MPRTPVQWWIAILLLSQAHAMFSMINSGSKAKLRAGTGSPPPGLSSFDRLLYTAAGPAPDHAAPTPRKSKKGGDALSSERDSPWRADAGGAEKAERALGTNAAARGAAS